MNVTSFRLTNQYLAGNKFTSPEEVIRHLGAVQSQDYKAARWSLGIRFEDSTDEAVEKAYNDGRIIRTHIMRPTWHFIIPEDLVWMQKLTSQNVKRLMGHYNKKLELTEDLFRKTNRTIISALKNKNFLTRKDLKTVLTKIKIDTNVQRLAHIIMWAELDGLVCSGPRIGKQFSYALVEERIKKHISLSGDEALAKLATKFFTSHGPAQLKDFSWWSGLSIKNATIGLDSIKSTLTSEKVNEKTYWYSKNIDSNIQVLPQAFLLSIFDEYVIAYKDRSDLNSNEMHIEKMLQMGSFLIAVVILNGKVIGTWKRILKKDLVQVKLNLFDKLSISEIGLVEKAAEDYSKFLNLKLELV